MQATDRETLLQQRLSIILRNLPPVSQLPRFTAAEIEATVIRFEQSIISLVALRTRIDDTVIPRIGSSEYEDNDENNCSAALKSDYYDSEPESEQADI